MTSLNFESQISEIFKLNQAKHLFIDQQVILLLCLEKENNLLSASEKTILAKEQNEETKIKLKNIQERLESNKLTKREIFKTRVILPI